MSGDKRANGGKIRWEFDLEDGHHEVQFSHGTTTGSRHLVVDGETLLFSAFMFKLVGTMTFEVGAKRHSASVTIAA